MFARKRVALFLLGLLTIAGTLGANADALRLTPDGDWLFMVNPNHRLRIGYAARQAGDEFGWAARQWNTGQTNVRLVFDRGKPDVLVGERENCNLDAPAMTSFAGQYDPVNRIVLDRCSLDWPGGLYPGAGEYRPEMPPSQRYRAASHELGHALGLDDRNGYNTTICDTVMKEIPSWIDPNCAAPSEDDLNEVNGFSYN